MHLLWFAILHCLCAGQHTHTHTPLGFGLPSQNSSISVFVNELDFRFNMSVESIIGYNPTCDAWSRFLTDPADSNMPFCPLYVCQYEIRRANTFLLPSVLASKNAAQLASFSFCLEVERLFFSLMASIHSLYSFTQRWIWDLMYTHASTFLLAYSVVPWKSLLLFYRFIMRTARGY